MVKQAILRTSVCHINGEELIDEPLKGLEDEFSPDFIRIHRNALVAIKHLEALEKDDTGRCYARIRHSDMSLPVSRRHAPDLRRIIREG